MLNFAINNYRKRIESHISGVSSPGISYGKDGSKYWRGKKLVDIRTWCDVRRSRKWDYVLSFMPECFEPGPLGVRFVLPYQPELTDSFEKWLNDYYDYLVFIGDTVEEHLGEDMWDRISK